MAELAAIAGPIRDKIIADPDVILEDSDLMGALIAANEAAMGGNIVDLRGIAMKRMQERLDQLENTHQSVIAAAYDNVAGMQQIHRAILRMLDPVEFEGFLKSLGEDVADILRVDCIRLVLESAHPEDNPALSRLSDVLCVTEPGFIDTYLMRDRNVDRPVVLRRVPAEASPIYGIKANRMRSEAIMRLDFGAGRLPGLLIMGSVDAECFKSGQGTDLLTFFAGTFERAMRRWLG